MIPYMAASMQNVNTLRVPRYTITHFSDSFPEPTVSNSLPQIRYFKPTTTTLLPFKRPLYPILVFLCTGITNFRQIALPLAKLTLLNRPHGLSFTALWLDSAVSNRCFGPNGSCTKPDYSLRLFRRLAVLMPYSRMLLPRSYCFEPFFKYVVLGVPPLLPPYASTLP